MHPNIQNLLSALGLTDKEQTIYIASLKHGPQSASTLSKRTGLARSTVSFIFNELIKKGFGNKNTKEKTTYYSVIQPESLEYIILEKQAESKRQMQEFKDLLPLLNSIQNQFSQVPKVQYYEGVDGLCRILDDFCKIDQTVLYISSHNNMHPKIRKYVYDVYLPICNKQSHKNKIILNEGKKSDEYKQKASKAYDEFIFTNPEKYKFSLTTAIYGDKVAFWSYDPKDMSGVIIENQLIADNMRTMFKALKENIQAS
jgi:sugar-specific transcriptional regulator TrmB